jgi:hypothetical protein
VTSLFFLGRLIVNFTDTHAKFSYQNFLMKKSKREEEEIDNEGRESSRSFFFPKFGRNLIIFAAFEFFN